MALILASGSEQRLKLLAQIGVVPQQMFQTEIDETPHPKETPRQTAVRLAHAKAAAAQTQFRDDFILAADTIVACGRKILDKPQTEDEARRHLRQMSGRAHHVYTALCLLHPQTRIARRINVSRVVLKRLSPQDIDAVIASGQWQGRAGGYHIHDAVMQSLIRKINGSPSGIAGMPLFEVRNLLSGAGLL